MKERQRSVGKKVQDVIVATSIGAAVLGTPFGIYFAYKASNRRSTPSSAP